MSESAKLLPDTAVIIPGAQKSGTSSLFGALAQHTEIAGASPKETHFLALDPELVDEHWDWYCGVFDSNHIWLDGSTSYLQSDRALANCSRLFDDTRVLIILRDPAKRAYSGYLHGHRYVPHLDQRSFDEVMESVSGPGAANILATEDSALRRALEEGHISVDRMADASYLEGLHKVDFGGGLEDPLWGYRYFSNSLYSRSVPQWESQCNRVKVIFFEDFINNEADAMSDVLTFLDLRPEPETLKSPGANKTRCSTRLTEALLSAYERFSPPARVRRILRVCGAARAFRMSFRDKPPLTEGTYSRIREALSTEYDYWFKREPRLRELWQY